MKREKRKILSAGTGQPYLPYIEDTGLQFHADCGEVLPAARRKTEGNTGGSEGFFKFFLGEAAIRGKLLYCKIPEHTHPDILARLSQLRFSDKESVKEVLSQAEAEIWVLLRVMGARVSKAWFGPFSSTDESFVSYLEEGTDGSGDGMVGSGQPKQLPLFGHKDENGDNVQGKAAEVYT